MQNMIQMINQSCATKEGIIRVEALTSNLKQYFFLPKFGDENKNQPYQIISYV